MMKKTIMKNEINSVDPDDTGVTEATLFAQLFELKGLTNSTFWAT